MKTGTKVLVLLLLALLCPLTFIALSVPEEIVLKVITRHGADILLAARKAFLKSDLAKEYGVKDIRFLPVGEPLWVDTIRSAGDIDVAWGGGPVLFDRLYLEGLLAPLKGDLVEEVMAKIPDEIRGSPMKRFDNQSNIYWVAAAISSFGFTINSDYLDYYELPEPDEWIDLANETYAVTLPQPSVGCADATKSTSNTRMYQIILQRYGWEKGWIIITLMAANSRIYDQSGLVRDAVIRGDIGVGITIDFYGYTAQLESKVCKYIVPKDGSIVNGDPIALLTTSKHPEAAKAFIAWVLSAEGQKIWLNPKINRLPANAEVFETPEGKERDDLKQAYLRTLNASVIEFSDELALSYQYAMQWFFHATLVRPQEKLQRAWMELVKAKDRLGAEKFKELTDLLANPLKFKFKDPITGKDVVFTQEYAQGINEEIFRNVDFRDDIVRIWKEAAERRYENVLKAVSG